MRTQLLAAGQHNSWRANVLTCYSAHVCLCVCQVLEGGREVESYPIDQKPSFIFGQTSCDLTLPAAQGIHTAALVHHTDSRLYLISLQSVCTRKRTAVILNIPLALHLSGEHLYVQLIPSLTHSVLLRHQGVATLLNGKGLSPNKPAHVKSGALISFSCDPRTFKVVCETAGGLKRFCQNWLSQRAV